jgi:hypothetical protein
MLKMRPVTLAKLQLKLIHIHTFHRQKFTKQGRFFQYFSQRQPEHNMLLNHLKNWQNRITAEDKITKFAAKVDTLLLLWILVNCKFASSFRIYRTPQTAYP